MGTVRSKVKEMEKFWLIQQEDYNLHLVSNSLTNKHIPHFTKSRLCISNLTTLISVLSIKEKSISILTILTKFKIAN